MSFLRSKKESPFVYHVSVIFKKTKTYINIVFSILAVSAIFKKTKSYINVVFSILGVSVIFNKTKTDRNVVFRILADYFLLSVVFPTLTKEFIGC